MPWEKGTSGNPSGRPRGVLDRRAALRLALEGRADALLAKAIEKALEGDTTVLLALLSKLIPKVKSESLPLENSITGDTPTQQSNALIQSVMCGDIGPSIAHDLLNAISCAMRIRESDELLARIEALEKRNNVEPQ